MDLVAAAFSLGSVLFHHQLQDPPPSGWRSTSSGSQYQMWHTRDETAACKLRLAWQRLQKFGSVYRNNGFKFSLLLGGFRCLFSAV